MGKTATQVKSELGDIIREVFDMAGFGHLGDSIKWGITVSIFVVPILLMICCIMICGGNSPEEEPIETKEDTKTKSKKKKLE